jgi:hypothetical protein
MSYRHRELATMTGTLVPRLPVLLVALFAVHWSALGRLERDLALLATIRTDGFVHLSGAAVVTAPVSITQFFHSF